MKAKYKAVKLYRWQHEDCDVLSDVPPNPKDKFAMSVTIASWVLPATPEAYDAIIEASARALAKGVAKNDNNPEWEENQLRYLFRDQAKRMLTAIGIKRPTPSPGAPLRRQGDEGKTAS